jgi:hypothetical protein
MQAKIFVGIPMYCQTGSPQNIASLLAMERQYGGLIGEYQFIGDSLVSRGRNNLVHFFLKSDHTHLLFIDADLSFGPQIAERLLSHDKDIVCGWYPKKQLEFAPVYNKLPAASIDPETALLEVRHAGTGMMLIRRNVIERMIEAHPELRYRRAPDEAHGGEYSHDLFSVGVVNEEYLSEDWYFCDRWRKLGGQVWVDTKCGAKHLGLIEYPTPFQLKQPEAK